VTNSFVIYVEGLVDPNLGSSAGNSLYESAIGAGQTQFGLYLTNNSAGQPPIGGFSYRHGGSA
jgi:hypothetical protein